jgi:hypothetical protein
VAPTATDAGAHMNETPHPKSKLIHYRQFAQQVTLAARSVARVEQTRTAEVARLDNELTKATSDRTAIFSAIRRVDELERGSVDRSAGRDLLPDKPIPVDDSPYAKYAPKRPDCPSLPRVRRLGLAGRS